MKFISLLALCSLLILVPSCRKQRGGCCPKVTSCCDSQPLTPTPYAEPLVEEIAEEGSVTPDQAALLEEYEDLDDLEEPKSEKKEILEEPTQAPSDKEALEEEEDLEDLEEPSETK